MDADVCNDFYHIHISETTVSEMAVSELAVSELLS